jgi:hypothetical protein
MFLPVIHDGEGDQAKPGGGVIGASLANYPSTTLRAVPLPPRFARGEALWR